VFRPLFIQRRQWLLKAKAKVLTSGLLMCWLKQRIVNETHLVDFSAFAGVVVAELNK
jgi:hypothetical protein